MTPADRDELPLELAQRVDPICDRFEADWQSAGLSRPPPRLEDYLTLAAEPERSLLLRELIQIEVHVRQRRGETPVVSDYLTRFADLPADWLASVVGLPPPASQFGQPAANPAGTRIEGPPLQLRLESIPSLAERYTITRLHAQGGLGQVWRARDTVLGREVALKELRPERTHQDEIQARFVEEARITGYLEHPGIVPVYDLAQHAQTRQPFYTMRFIKGRTLSEVCQAYHEKRQAGQAEALDLITLLNAFVAVCQAVAYAHSRHIVHRDLKGRNVVLGDFGEVILLDWGLAKFVGAAHGPGDAEDKEPVPWPGEVLAPSGREATAQGTILGTPAYMAPEQAEGRLADVDQRSDIYSLGALLYEILAGRPPFIGEDVEDLLRQVILVAPVPPRQVVPAVPPALEAICLKALAKKPHDRYDQAGDLAKEVQRCLADEPVTAYREPRWVRLRRWAKRHRTLVTSAAATAVVALLCLGLVTILLGAANRELTAANERERQAKEAAEANFKLARESVEKYLMKVTDDPLLKVAGFRDLRRKLLQEAGGFFERFIRERGQEPGLEAELARAYVWLAEVRRNTGAIAEAIDLIQQGLALLHPLHERHPTEARHLEDMAMAYWRLGGLFHSAGDPAKAEDANHRAESLYRQLLAAHPDDHYYKYRLAMTLNNLAVLADKRGDIEAAEKGHLAAFALQTEVVEAQGQVADYRRDLANIAVSLGSFYGPIGKLEESQKYLETALGHFNRLSSQAPQDLFLQQDLANVQGNLAVTYWLRQRRTEAAEAAERAVTAAQKLADQHRDVPEYQHDLAFYLVNMGELYDEIKSPAEGEPVKQRALAILKPLVAAYPRIPDYGNLLGKAHSSLGRTYRQMNRLADAETELLHAGKVLLDLAQAHAEVIDYQVDAARNDVILGQVQLAAGKAEAALEYFRQAIDRLEKLLKKVPRHAQTRDELIEARQGQVRALTQLGRSTEALAIWDQLLAATDGPQRDTVRLARAVTLARTGAHAPAVQEAEALAGGKDPSPATRYAVACVYALSAGVAGLDPPLADRYAARAIELLKEALAKGFNDRATLKTDKDLDSLRGRPAFQQLLADLDRQKPAK